MKVASLGSGSRGNATLVSTESTTILIDCGFSLRETERRLARLGVSASEITAVLVTHEHTDHIRGVGALARKYNKPVWMTHGTFRAGNTGELPLLNEITAEQVVELDDIQVTPFAVPHDAAEPCQFLFSNGDLRLGLLTDTGMITPHIRDMLSGIDALLLECNHDINMLEEGEYPETLKQRVGGNYGHLNNEQAAELLDQINISKLSFIAAMHISEKNNTAFLAKQALNSVLGWHDYEINIADQDSGLGWVRLN